MSEAGSLDVDLVLLLSAAGGLDNSTADFPASERLLNSSSANSIYSNIFRNKI